MTRDETINHTRPRLKVAVVSLAVLALAASVVAGYMNGTVDGDVPWPATESETAFYAASTWLTAVAGILALLTALLFSASRKLTIIRALFAVLGSLAVAFVVFMLGFVIGGI